MNKDNYSELSINYDLLQPKEEIFKQEEFFEKLIERYSIKTCLDCACGTGWHLVMLNNLKVQCDGSDLSESMLQKAEINLKGRSVNLKKEDFRTLSKSWTSKYDMIICMTTSFPHNKNDKEAIQTLNSAYDCLNQGGILVIDNGFSDLLFKTRPKYIPARITAEQAFYFIIEYPDNQDIVVFNILNVIKTPTGFDNAFETIDYLAIGKEKFENLFSKTDYSKVEYYGNYEFEEYSIESSKRMIAIAQK